MIDDPGSDLVVADEPGQDGQTRSVGAGPGIRPQVVGPQVPDRARPGMPARGRVLRRVELVEAAAIAIDDEQVVIAAGLDQRMGGDRIGTGVRLAGIVEGHANQRPAPSHHVERNPVARIRAEVGMQPAVRADGRDHVCRVGRDGQVGNSPVPGVVRRKDRAARSSRDRMAPGAGGSRRRGCRGGYPHAGTARRDDHERECQAEPATLHGRW